MDNEKIKDELLKIQKEIEDLPKGYISKKKINEKTKYYLQWNEDKKKKSKYIDDSLICELSKKIERRRELQNKEKELKLMLNEPKSKSKNNKHKFFNNVLFGNELKKYVLSVKDYKKRNIYKNIHEYLYENKQEKVLILYGLRRTGKTTLIRQIINEMNESDFLKAAFIQVKPGSLISDINQDLKYLENNNYKYIFIDEVTLIEDFIDGAALFSDIYATSGMKIVLSGTDSLGFYFSSDDSLYDRAIFLHTTFIPYKEFEEVLGIKGIDEYICYGGTMSMDGINYNNNSIFVSKKTINEYVDSAIAKNIQHSLKYYEFGGHFRSLYKLYENNELTSAINRIVEDYNHKFALEVLTRDFKSHDLGISSRNFRNDRNNPNDILDRINKEEFTDRLKNLLEIKNKNEQKVEILDENRIEIKEYLDALDLTNDIEIRSLPVNNSKNYKTIFTQPGLRYSQAKELIKSLLEDEEFQNLSINEINAITQRILNDIKGRMMEDIVLLETKMAFPKKEVFQLQFKVGKFDMVIFDRSTLSCEIYEIKHNKEIVKDQYRHLIDEDKINKTEFKYGKITKKVVIYRGEDEVLENNIEYKNVEKYLKSLKY